MLVRDFADLAAILAGHAPAIIQRTPVLPERAVQAYWVAARSRLNWWGQQLRRLQLLQGSGLLNHTARREDLKVLEEILVSEMVTRIWCAVLDGIDEHLGLQEYGPIGRSTHLGHVEARQRVLRLIVGAHREGPISLWLLNQLRIHTERWTDLLLSCLPSPALASPYCFDEQRLRNFRMGRDPVRRGASPASLLIAAGGELFSARNETPMGNDDLHRQVHRAILGCLSDSLFSGTGAWEGSWPARLATTTDEILVGLDSWLGLLSEPADPPDGRRGTLGRF